MKCKKLVSLFLSLLLATALAVPACAAFEDVFADGSADGTRDGSLFLSGETVRSSAAVNGVLLAAGRTVDVNGTGAYVMAAGYEVTLGGTAENDAFLAGYSIGVTLVDYAQMFVDEGCTLAYNMDGGISSGMLFMGESVQLAENGGVDENDRAIPDILCAGTY